MPRFCGSKLSQIHCDHLRSKTFYYYLIKILRKRFDLCLAESELISLKIINYLESKLQGERRYNQLIVPAHTPKKSRKAARSFPVRLTYYDLSDIEVEEFFGKNGVRYNRILRYFEEGFSQGAVFRTTQICHITGVSRSMVSKIIRYYRDEGVRLLLRGQQSKIFDGIYRDCRATELFLSGIKEEIVLQRLIMSKAMLNKALEELSLIGKLSIREFSPMKISEVTIYPLSKILDYLCIWQRYRASSLLPEVEIESNEYIEEYGKAISKESLSLELSRDHDFTVGAMRLFFKEIEDLSAEMSGACLLDNQVIYYAVSEDVGAGHPLSECKLVHVVLTIFTEDEDHAYLGDASPSVQKSKTRILKENRITRLSIESKHQLGLLSIEDISYLTGLHRVSISVILKGLRSRGIEPPLRGVQKDIGKGLSHEVKAIEYFLCGYSLDIIASRLHHGLDQLIMYQQRFKRVMLLHEDGYSPTMISVLSGLSQHKIDNLLVLYEKYKDKPEYKQKLSWIRNLGGIRKKNGGSNGYNIQLPL